MKKLGHSFIINFPESWIYSFKRHSNKTVYLYFLKIIAVVLLFFIILPFLPIIFLFMLYGMIREKIIIGCKLNRTLPTVRFIKYIEEKNKFQKMKEVFNSNLHELGIDNKSVSSIICAYMEKIEYSDISISKLIIEKCKRSIVREFSSKKDSPPIFLKMLIEWTISDPCPIKNGIIDWSTLCAKFRTIDSFELQNLLQTLIYEENSQQQLTSFAKGLSAEIYQNYTDLKNHANNPLEIKHNFSIRLEKLFDVLQDKSDLENSNPKKANRKFIAAYRRLLSHSIYKTRKLDYSSPLITLLHEFSSAIWNEVNFGEIYQEVGKAIIYDGQLSKTDNNALLTQNKNSILAQKLNRSQKIVASNHYHNDGVFGKIIYASMHFWHIMGSFASEGGIIRLIPSLFGVDQYDSHGTLSNNPSVQGTTKWQGEGWKGVVNNCYGGSPTIGDHRIAPEFEALLQAAENNLMCNEKFRRSHIPVRVVYNNLQNLDKKHGENFRSHSIMYLNKTFPLSFTGLILAKDSPLYFMKNSEDVIWEGANQFGEVFKQKILHGVHSPAESGHGFYFPGSLEEWKPLFDAAIDLVSKQFCEMHALTIEDKRMLQGAFQDYVYSLIGAVVECAILANLNLVGISSPLITVLSACKENIDRGGMENLKYAYLRLGNEEQKNNCFRESEKLEILVGFMNARSLSARDRAILGNRLFQVLSFIEIVSQENFNKELTELLKIFNLSAQYTFRIGNKE